MQIFKVDGMTCGHCERAVTSAVHSVDAAASVAVDRAAGIVRVESQAAAAKPVAAIEAEGYGAHAVASQDSAA